MPLAILRTAKVKAFKDLTLLEQHNNRTRPTAGDPERLHLNQMLVGDPSVHLADAVRQRIEAGLPGQKIRSNAVLAIDVLMSASPEYFRPGEADQAGKFDRARTDRWAQASMDWLAAKFGKDNVVRGQLHLDESTPHIHATVVPLDGRGKLNARGVIGGSRNVLRELQSSYADAVKPLGIDRGLAGSTAKHQEVSKFYAVANAAVEPTPAPGEIRKVTVLDKTTLGLATHTHRGFEVTDRKAMARTLRAATKHAVQANKVPLLEGRNRDLSKANATLKTGKERADAENIELKAQLAQYRGVPALDVLRAYNARSVGKGHYEVRADKRLVDVHRDGEHHRVVEKGAVLKSGKKSRSAIDLVCSLERWEATGESAQQACEVLAAKLPGAGGVEAAAQAFALHVMQQARTHGQLMATKAQEAKVALAKSQDGAGKGLAD